MMYLNYIKNLKINGKILKNNFMIIKGKMGLKLFLDKMLIWKF